MRDQSPDCYRKQCGGTSEPRKENAEGRVGREPMIEDRELDAWREQWVSVAEPPAGFQRKIQLRIKRQDRRFVIGNILTVIAFLGILIFALVMRHQSSWMGTGWATSICVLVLVFVSAGVRTWVVRRTWRPETQSTRAFVELWYKRVAARIRLLRISRSDAETGVVGNWDDKAQASMGLVCGR